MDERLEDMCRGMKSLGAEVGDIDLPDLGPCELHHVENKEIKDSGVVEHPDTETDPQSDS